MQGLGCRRRTLPVRAEQGAETFGEAVLPGLFDRGVGVGHSQGGEDMRGQVIGVGLCRDGLDDRAQGVVPEVGVFEGGAGCVPKGHRRQVPDTLFDGRWTGDALGKEPDRDVEVMGDTAGVVQTLRHGDPGRCRFVGDPEPRQIPLHRGVKLDLSRLHQLHDRERGEPLTQRRKVDGCLRGQGPAGVVGLANRDQVLDRAVPHDRGRETR